MDKKFSNYTQVEIEGECISDDKSKKLYEINFEDTDILIIEVPKGKDYVFRIKQDEEPEDEDQV